MNPRLFVFFLCIVTGATVSTGVRATEAAWARLATGGYTVLMTHADAPGIGDPPFFDIDDCTTQRNLSDRGRQQARRWGVRFAARAVSITQVYASNWCRTLETAENAFRDATIEATDALDLSEDGAAMPTDAAIDLIGGFRGPGNQVLLTHPETIEALTGTRPRTGEAILVAPARGGDDASPPVQVVARLLLN